ncbi:MAG: hypothetical protein DRI48_09470 [Chloroflexi bacterium]|nr:MAG: hypothetical protein DRI48_09470 [Chloroflexota bacterium]
MNEEQATQETWHEVGEQFRVLGESLAKAFRTAWEREENRQNLESMTVGLESIVDNVGRAIREAAATPEARKARQEVEQAVQSARVAGRKALQDAQPHLISALRRVNADLQHIISRLEQDVEQEETELKSSSTTPASPESDEYSG